MTAKEPLVVLTAKYSIKETWKNSVNLPLG